MAYLESLVQEQFGGRVPGTPSSAGKPAPQAVAPKPSGAPGLFSAPAGNPNTRAMPRGAGGAGMGLPPSPSRFALQPPPQPGGLPPMPADQAAPGQAAPGGIARPGRVAPQSAAPATAPVPSNPFGPATVAMERSPNAVDFASHPEGTTFQTPYGNHTIGPDGKATVSFPTPQHEEKYRQAVAEKKGRFGPMPKSIASIPGMPAPPVTLEGSSFNPFTGQFVR